MGLREEKKQEQRRAILAVALELFRAQGFEATRVQDITERLRISEGTFFNYFPTKAAVLDAAAVDILDRATILLHHDVADHDRAVLDRLEELVRDFAANFAGDREFAVQLALHTRLGLGREREQQTHRSLAELVEEGQRRGEIRADVGPRQLAELFMAVVLVTVSNWLLFPGDESPPDDDGDDGPLDEALLQAWVVFRDGTATRPRPARRPSVASAASSRRR
ncbi:MAG TPA: TetR/AcrR family transcriptional regulator [Acidimicrobiia bacterium]|nr:TetR/AcrR family transcriptional regulator [Acidimicrobiia bacterium]HMC80233.1 TetR/AcrR family transcriptional regulator [Acidimicrobiia bacterium]